MNSQDKHDNCLGMIISSELGFTLVEVLIVVVIVGVLAAIAYPSYVESVRKTRRADAQASLTELANFVERRYTEVNSYAGIALPFNASPQTGTKYYDLSFDGNPTATTYVLQAVPVAPQDQDSCGTLKLDYTGVRTPANGCW